MNTQNDIARENARRTDGKFGSYQLPDAGTDADLGGSTSTISNLPHADFCSRADARMEQLADGLALEMDIEFDNYGGSVGALELRGVGLASVNPPGECNPGHEGRWGIQYEDGTFVESQLTIDGSDAQIKDWLQARVDGEFGQVQDPVLSHAEMTDDLVNSTDCLISDSTARTIAACSHGDTEFEMRSLSHGLPFNYSELIAEADVSRSDFAKYDRDGRYELDSLIAWAQHKRDEGRRA